jgi:Ser/Thr protein kinase RdoA (MazF antagonist)
MPWWDHPLFGDPALPWHHADAFDRDFQASTEQFARFTDRFGAFIPLERRDLYERLLDRAPHLLARYHTYHNLTIIHGDAHPWNFFLPRDDGGKEVKLIDWEKLEHRNR